MLHLITVFILNTYLNLDNWTKIKKLMEFLYVHFFVAARHNISADHRILIFDFYIFFFFLLGWFIRTAQPLVRPSLSLLLTPRSLSLSLSLPHEHSCMNTAPPFTYLCR